MFHLFTSRRSQPARLGTLVVTLALLAFAGAPQIAAGDAAGADPLAWNAQTLGATAKEAGGQLLISPGNADWGATAVVSRDVLPFWSASGTSITMRIEPQPTKDGGNLDGIIAAGFITTAVVQRVQASDNFVGVNIAVTKARNQCIITLARKEAVGNEANRGDKSGNAVPYPGGKNIIVPVTAQGFDLVLTANASTITAAVPGVGELTQPHGLTAENWKRPHLAVQSMHFAAGRMSVAVSRAGAVLSALDPGLFHAIDLAPVANVGLADTVAGDKQGGWTDQGANDLRHLRTGRQVLRGIPFSIADPAANKGQGAVMLWSSGMEHLPRSVGPIPVRRTADSLIFLHTAAWAGKSGGVAASYQIAYEDGTTTEIPVKVGSQIRDWWSMQEVDDVNAAMLAQVKSDASPSGQVGIYGYRWVNPKPKVAIASLTLGSAGSEVRTGVLAVTVVSDALSDAGRSALAESFSHDVAMDPRRNPPDKDSIPDQVVVRASKPIMPLGVSVAGADLGGGFGARMLDLPGYPELIRTFGGVSRFPHGSSIQFFFWPHRAEDWNPAVLAGGGRYGIIPNWHTKYDCAKITISYQEMLAGAKRSGQKLILLFNMHAMFDGKQFIYVKTLPEERMRAGHDPLKEGVFSRENLDRIVKNNATLVDYVLKNGYEETVAFWEMDNERWDAKGAEYADMVAGHLAMLRERIPKARVIVCHGDFTYGGYNPDPDKMGISTWSRDLLVRLREVGATSIDYFAPHLYPFLLDKDGEITANFVGDWQVRNIYRSLDYFSKQLDAHGFTASRMYATEWGSQSDSLGGMSRNDLNDTMAGALASAKTVMAVFSHPRIDGATWHPFIHQSAFGRKSGQQVKPYGVQTVYMGEDGRVILTPPAQAVKMFTSFMAAGGNLQPLEQKLPDGVHCLVAADAQGRKRYFVVNGTTAGVTFPAAGITARTTLSAPRLTDGAVNVFAKFGDTEGEFAEIVPVEAADAVLPPFSVNHLR